jgi:hypothetical protein
MIISLRNIHDEETIIEEWLISRMRYQRELLLKESDWTQVADAPVDKQAWAEYRQALRDFPSTWTPSETVEFPLSPLETE